MNFSPILAKRIEIWPIERLKPYERNARTHSDKQIAQVAASIVEFGFTNPILVDSDDGIVAGHGRLIAARKLGMTEVPVVVLDHLTDVQRRAYIIADNKIAQNAGWDDDLLALELTALDDEGYNLELTGFSDEELDEYLDRMDEEQEPQHDGDAESIPDVQAPVSVLGDVWLLGDHRVMCGDSTSFDDLTCLMGNAQADIAVCSMAFTDPPWNVNYGDFKAGRKGRKILNDNMDAENWEAFCRDIAGSLIDVTANGAPVYLVMRSSEWPVMDSAMRDAGFHWSSTIIWYKDKFVIGRRDYHSQYEPIWYGWNGNGARLCPVEDRTQSDVWEFARPKKSDLHPTTKPVELIKRALRNSSKPGAVVVDLFGGSGSTLIACEDTGRSARLMELDPKYVDVIVKRWQEYTGEQAKHAKTGQTFNELAQSRPANDNVEIAEVAV